MYQVHYTKLLRVCIYDYDIEDERNQMLLYKNIIGQDSLQKNIVNI